MKSKTKSKTITLTIKNANAETEAVIKKVMKGQMWMTIIDGKLHAVFPEALKNSQRFPLSPLSEPA